jgi:hypothetical protein
MTIAAQLLQTVRTTLILAGVLAILAITVIETMPGHRPAGAFEARPISLGPPVPSSPIVGRASCGRTIWILNRAMQLIAVEPASGHTTIHQIHGIPPGATPQGLACVADGTLWTLETPHLLARLTEDGHVTDRTALRLPRTALFAAGDRIVFHQLPTVPAAAILASSDPRDGFEARAWPGLTSRSGSDSGELVRRNLVNCGMAAGGFLPCWFADEARMTISNGLVLRTVSIRADRAAAAREHEMPIWDAAVLESGTVWVLASAAPAADGRRAGRSLIRIDNAGAERARIPLSPAARLIVFGDDTRCTVLTTRGHLMEFTVN